MALAVNEVLTLSFKGRASRRAYWYSMAVFACLFPLTLALLAGILGTEDSLVQGTAGFFSQTAGVLLGMILLAELLFLVAAVVRRLHDISYSGTAALFLLIPGIQLIVLVLLGCFPGKKGLNRFGPDPLAIMTISSAVPSWKEEAGIKQTEIRRPHSKREDRFE